MMIYYYYFLQEMLGITTMARVIRWNPTESGWPTTSCSTMGSI